MRKTKGNLFKATLWYQQQYIGYYLIFGANQEEVRRIAADKAYTTGCFIDRITIKPVPASELPW